MERKAHWEGVYGKKKSTEVSWYQPEPELSLKLIDQVAPRGRARVIDVGGGASSLVDCLLDREYVEISVLDLSGAALREPSTGSATDRRVSRGSKATFSPPNFQKRPTTCGTIAPYFTS